MYNRQGAQMAEILNPTNGVRGAIEAKGQKPKNHMAANRAALRAKEQENQARRDEMSNTKTDVFKMTKFKNVESKVQMGRPSSAAVRRSSSAAKLMTGEGEEEKKAIVKEPIEKKHIAFGANTSQNKVHGGIPRAPRPGNVKQLTTSNLQSLNRINSKKPGTVVSGRRPVDPEVVPFPGDLENRENVQNNGSGTPRHKDFGKVPKYLQKYNKEADELAEKRAELKEKKKLPPGMKKMDEAERIATLEQLQSTKRELHTLMQGLPISLRSEALKVKKQELEDRLAQVEKAITTFSRRVVYVQE